MSALPAPPYYAVIFTSQRTPTDAGYGDMADRMVALAAEQPGYLGMESARGDDGLGITVSYWRSSDDILAWRRHAEHKVGPRHGAAATGMHTTACVSPRSSGPMPGNAPDGAKDPQA